MMLKNLKPHNIRIKITQIRYSALFVNGTKASDSFVFVTPHIDYEENIKDVESIQSNLNARKLDFNLTELHRKWDLYFDLKSKKNKLEERKSELSNQITVSLKSKGSEDDVTKYKIHLNIVKENLKHLKMCYWEAEEQACSQALKLPNKLHPKTPTDGNSKIIFSHKNKSINSDSFLKYVIQKHGSYYLKKEAALFELSSIYEFSKMLKRYGFVQFSNPDFVKSVTVEGCGLDHQSSADSFILHDDEETSERQENRMHLVGGSSLHSFFAYHAKNVLHSNSFPLKYYNIGRQYVPNTNTNIASAKQTTAVVLFSAFKTSNELENYIDSLTKMLIELYKVFNCHFQIKILKAEELLLVESLRVSLEMWSNISYEYIEVAYISVSDDFISKRLLLSYQEDKSLKFPKIISGTVLNVNKLLECIQEEHIDCLWRNASIKKY